MFQNYIKKTVKHQGSFCAIHAILSAVFPGLFRPWVRVCLRWVRLGPGSTWLWRRKCCPNTWRSCSQTSSCSGQNSLTTDWMFTDLIVIKKKEKPWQISFFPLTGSCINLMRSCSVRKKGSSFCSTCSPSTLWTISASRASSPPSVCPVNF